MKKLKLTSISSEKLSEKETQGIMGGNCCGCGCMYRNGGGSGVESNRMANYGGNLWSKEVVKIKCDDPQFG
jgi:natural product precursor